MKSSWAIWGLAGLGNIGRYRRPEERQLEEGHLEEYVRLGGRVRLVCFQS